MLEVFIYLNRMAKKRNRGKKSSGTKPNTAAVSENQSQPSSIEDKTIAVKTHLPVEEIGSASSTKSEKNSSDVSVKTDGKDGCGLLASAQKVGPSKDFPYSCNRMQY